MKSTQRKPGEAINSSMIDGRSPYLLWVIWVVWLPLIIPGILPIFHGKLPLPRIIAILVLLLLFFVIYLRASWMRAKSIASGMPGTKRTEYWTWVSIISLSLITFVLALLDGSPWLQLMYYTSGFAGGSLSLRRSILAAVGGILLIIIMGRFIGARWLDLAQALIFVPAIIFITRSVIWSIITSWELRAAREEISRLAVMTERLRIARDLHDLLGHNLSLIALKSELAGRLVGIAPERAISEIGDVEQVARTTLQEVREAVSNYRQPTLISELHAAQEILFAAGIAYRYEGDEGILDSLPNQVETLLSWAVREGVTNVIRHSRGHQCTVSVKRDGRSVCVVVIDDGTARLEAPSTTGNPGSGGNGLRGLSERVEALGGSFEAGPRVGGGYRLAVSVPVGTFQRVVKSAESSPIS